MDTKDILFQLRTQRGRPRTSLRKKSLSQGRRCPAGKRRDHAEHGNTEVASQFFDVSINTLLGAPRQLVCQCCGMPLEDSVLSREPDGAFNEDYCKWCYADGEFKYSSPEQLIDFCVAHMASEQWPPEQVRAHMEAVVPQLKHWKK